ncbi:hypothetical protein CK203_059907 [Vitis vinifera]|uniref:Uncharacterized protein n=1 Tax=Vitis vinifera TaxID=29760 RepID=A0A438GNT4_VITVI|nr:hypothetical protein CK203_059907 [Vitis vinifera]
MALEAAAAGAAVETAVTEKARELWELRNGIREGISQNRIRPDTTEWMANVEMNESEVIELDTKYNDRKNHPWKLFRFGKGASLSKDMAEKYKQVLSLWEEGKRKRGVLDAELPKRVDCKVVLASRDLGICREMDVDETINVKPLSSDEAFNMFKEKVGEFINSIPRVVQVGQLVVRECGGLPLLIDKFAKTFKRMGGNVSIGGCTGKFAKFDE